MDGIMENKPVVSGEDTQLELLREIKQRLDTMEKREKRRRVRNWIVFALVLALALATAAIAVPQIIQLTEQYRATEEKLQELTAVVDALDFEKLEDAAEFVSSIDYEKLQQLSAVLESLDAEELQSQINEVMELIDELGKLNTGELVENINLIIEKIKPIMDFLKR